MPLTVGSEPSQSQEPRPQTKSSTWWQRPRYLSHFCCLPKWALVGSCIWSRGNRTQNRHSDMWCRCPKQLFNHCAKCPLPFTHFFLLVSLTIDFTIFIIMSCCFWVTSRRDRKSIGLLSHETEELGVFSKIGLQQLMWIDTDSLWFFFF